MIPFIKEPRMINVSEAKKITNENLILENDFFKNYCAYLSQFIIERALKGFNFLVIEDSDIDKLFSSYQERYYYENNNQNEILLKFNNLLISSLCSNGYFVFSDYNDNAFKSKKIYISW